jgi:cyanophycinase
MFEGVNVSFGNMIIIGGAEDKKDQCEILKHVINKINDKSGPLLLLTAATNMPEEVGNDYRNVFKRLGYDRLQQIDIKDRSDVENEHFCNMLENCSCIFFTGGDQLKITSLLGGTILYKSIKKAYEAGILFVGTSAGASCLCSTMIVSGIEEEAPRKCTIKMSPGLDIIQGVLIDQHFSQRGRIGRLLNAVAQNPGILGIGIDENTAVVFEQDSSFKILGSGAVTIIDGRGITYTNVSELAPDEILAITDIKMHILPKNCGYDVAKNISIIN